MSPSGQHLGGERSKDAAASGLLRAGAADELHPHLALGVTLLVRVPRAAAASAAGVSIAAALAAQPETKQAQFTMWCNDTSR